MKVIIEFIDPYLLSRRIESFIYAVLNKEQHFVLPLPPPTDPRNHTSAHSKGRLQHANASSASSVPPVPVDKGFFFQRRMDPDYDTGSLMFSRSRVGIWFLEFAQRQDFVKKNRLRLSLGDRIPSAAFVRAITENSTAKRPSTSLDKHTSLFDFNMGHAGYWVCPGELSYVYSSSGRGLYLSIDERSVIEIHFQNLTLSFLPTEVKAWSSDFPCDDQERKKARISLAVVFELKQNPHLSSRNPTAAATGRQEWHSYQLPSRVIRVAFALDKHCVKEGKDLWNMLSSLLGDVPKLDLTNFKMVQDDHSPFIDEFFRKSEGLGLELAFHREALLRNELLDMSTMTRMSAILDKQLRQGQQELALRTLKNFLPKLEVRQERGKTKKEILDFTDKLWDEACTEAVGNDSRGLFASIEPIDDHLAPMFHIDVTPTRVLLSGPHCHVSNRVLRTYRKWWFHFARVTFTNEDRSGATMTKANYGFAQSETYINGRVRSILQNGLFVAGRHWELLAWSSSSMSSHTVWFVTPFVDASGHRITADFIRKGLGDFSDVIRSPAQYGARLSQAFSATACTVQVPKEHQRREPDILTSIGEVCTDGVGQISTELMAEVWERLVSTHGEHRKRRLLRASAPSAIQFRLGGSKGVLAVNPRLEGKVVVIRPSMTKFGSPHQDLEVANSSSRPLPARLNRPLINALGDRGVAPEAFLEIQQEAIAQIGRARSNFKETAKLCSVYSFGTGCNLRVLFEKIHKLGLAAKTVDGESFFCTLAKAVTAAALGDMKRKARIPVKGVTLLGIADEFGLLKEGEVFAQVETGWAKFDREISNDRSSRCRVGDMRSATRRTSSPTASQRHCLRHSQPISAFATTTRRR